MMAHARSSSSSSCFCLAPHKIPSGHRNLQLSRLRQRRTATFMADAAPDLLQAAKHTVDMYVRNGMVVGLGSGRASALAIQYMGRQMREGALQQILGIPTSLSSASEAERAGIPLQNYQDSLQIDFAFDDADVVEEGTLTAIIGRRKLDSGESIIQAKSIVETAGSLALILSENQYSREIEGSIPVLISTGNWMQTAEEIDDLFLGDAEVWRRSTFGNAGPMGGDYPVVTAEGHHILDVIFTSPILDLAEIADNLDRIDGVVNHGVITGIPCTAIIASKTGVMILDNLSKIRT